MSAAIAVQQALVAALNVDAGVSAIATGVFDGAPAEQPLPYVAVGDGQTSDWSTKTEAGREVRVVLAVVDDGEMPSRLHRLIAACEAAVESMARVTDGWRVASVTLVRSRVVRERAGRWVGWLEYRVRVLAE